MRKNVGVVITCKKKKKVLLVSVGEECWMIPGGEVRTEETTEDAARREIKEKLNLELDTVKHFFTILSREGCDTYYSVDTENLIPLEKHGEKYQPQWVDFDEIESLNIQPENCKSKLIHLLT